MVSPTLAELRARCNEREIAWSTNLTRAELISLLTPSYNDRSLNATIERDFLGVDVPLTPMAMLPLRNMNAPRAPRNPITRKTSPVRRLLLDDEE